MALAKVNKIPLHVSSTNLEAPKYSMGVKPELPDKGELVPGPGKYGVPSTAQKFKRTPTFGFGSSVRATEKEYKGQPGPGTYNPYDPNQTAPQYGFGTASRIPVRKPSGVPPPGTYKVATKLFDRQMTMGGKREGKKLTGMPGPGQYSNLAKGFEQTWNKDPVWVFGSGERQPFWRTEETPDPGRYNLPKEFGGELSHAKSTPNFSLYGRRKVPRADSTPAPNIFPQYSQF